MSREGRAGPDHGRRRRAPSRPGRRTARRSRSSPSAWRSPTGPTTGTSGRSSPRPGAAPRQLTTDERSDNEPDVGQPSRLEPRLEVDRLRPGRPRQAHLLRPPPARRRAGRRRRAADPDRRSDLNVLSPQLHRRRRVDPLHARGRPGGRPGEDRVGGRADRAPRRGPPRRLGVLPSRRRPRRDPDGDAESPRRDLRGREGRAAAPVEAERRLARRGAGSERSRRRSSRARTEPRSTASSSSRRTTSPGSRYPTILRVHGGPVGPVRVLLRRRVAVVRRQRLRRPRRRTRAAAPDGARSSRPRSTPTGATSTSGRARRGRRRGRPRHLRPGPSRRRAGGATAAC